MTRHLRRYTVMGATDTTPPETGRNVPLAFARTRWGANRLYERLAPLHPHLHLYVQLGEQESS